MDTIEFVVVCVFIHFVIGAAKVTSPIRKRLLARAPEWLSYLVRCAACSGTWIGLALSPWGPWGDRGWWGVALSAAFGCIGSAVAKSLMMLHVEQEQG